jgi:hypothetical protein
MYQLTAGLLKSRARGSSFEEKDLSSYKVKSLLRDYKETYLVLSHFAMTGPITLRLKDAERLIVSLSTDPTVTEWLTGLGNTALPTLTGLPKVIRKSILARDPWQAGFSATLCVPFGSPFNETTDADKTDIWLTRDKTDYVTSQSHALATVNGLLHRVDADKEGMYIINGGVTFRRSKNAILGLLSFESIGKIKTHAITPDMIYHTEPTGKLSDSAFIKLPFNAAGKVVGVVIGGYLHLVSSDVKVLGDKSIKLLMNRIPYWERYMESRGTIDMSSMERFHKVNETDISLYDNAGFNSDECIKELLTLSQSFLVEIATDNMSVRAVKTTNTGLPGRFYWHEQPLFPLRTELGKLPSYVSFEEDGVFVLCIDNNLVQRRVFTQIENQDRLLTTEARQSNWARQYHRGDLVQWSNESVKIVKPVV